MMDPDQTALIVTTLLLVLSELFPFLDIKGNGVMHGIAVAFVKITTPRVTRKQPTVAPFTKAIYESTGK